MSGVTAEDMLGKGDYEYALPFYGICRPVLIDLVFKSNEELEQKYHYVKRNGELLMAETHVPMQSGPPCEIWAIARGAI